MAAIIFSCCDWEVNSRITVNVCLHVFDLHSRNELDSDLDSDQLYYPTQGEFVWSNAADIKAP